MNELIVRDLELIKKETHYYIQSYDMRVKYYEKLISLLKEKKERPSTRTDSIYKAQLTASRDAYVQAHSDFESLLDMLPVEKHEIKKL